MTVISVGRRGKGGKNSLRTIPAFAEE